MAVFVDDKEIIDILIEFNGVEAFDCFNDVRDILK